MKKYTLNIDTKDYIGSYQLFPRFNAQNIESQNILNDNLSYFNQFLPDDTSFKNMSLGYIGEGGFPKEPHAIADMHSWIIKQPNGLMYPISPRFKELLEKFNIPFSKFYTGSVTFKGIEHTYYIIHILAYQYHFIDFEKSTFFKGNLFLERISDTSVSGENIEEIKEQVGHRWIFNKAVMKSDFKDVDMYYLDSYQILISERLKNAIEEANLTGVKITPCPIEFHLSNEV